MSVRAAALAFVALALGGPAAADPRSEAMLRDLVEEIDRSSDWIATVSLIRTEGDDTIAEGLVFSRAEPRIDIAVERLRLADLEPREGSGFVAAEVEMTGGALRSDLVDYAIPTALASEVALPSLEGISFDTKHLMTALGAFYSRTAEGELEELSIPEISGVQRQPAADGAAPTEMRVVYRDVRASRLRGGVLESQELGPITISGSTPEGDPVGVEFGRLSVDRLDLGALGRILDAAQYRDGRGDDIWRPLASRIAYSGLSVQGADDVTFRLDEFAVENLDGRQTEKPLTPLWDRILDPETPQDRKNDLALEAVQTMFGAWRVGTIRLHGMAVEAPVEQASFSLDTITVSGLSNAGIDSVLLRNMNGKGVGGFAQLAAFEMAGLVFPDLDALMQFASLESDLDPAQHAGTIRSSFAALPRLSHFGFSGLSAGESPSEAVTVESFALDLGGWNEVYATSTELRVEGLQVPRSLMQLDAETAATFDTLELDPMVLGLSFSDSWSPESGTVDDTWTMSLRDGADVELSYRLAGVTMDWVTSAIAAAGRSEDSEAALIAMYSDLALQRAALRITDKSLLDRAFAVAAQKQSLSVDGAAYREQMRSALPFLLSAAVPADLSKLLSAPLQSFLAGGQMLIAEFAPAQAIPLPELMLAAGGDPMTLPARLGLILRTEPAQ